MEVELFQVSQQSRCGRGLLAAALLKKGLLGTLWGALAAGSTVLTQSPRQSSPGWAPKEPKGGFYKAHAWGSWEVLFRESGTSSAS